MKKSKDKGGMKKSKKKEKDKEKGSDGKKAALKKLLSANDDDDGELGWTKVGAGGIIPGDLVDSEHCQVEFQLSIYFTL